jgi:hypothetical protein
MEISLFPSLIQTGSKVKFTEITQGLPCKNQISGGWSGTQSVQALKRTGLVLHIGAKNRSVH